MRRDEHISGHWIWADFFVNRQGCWQVVARRNPHGETVVQLSESTKAAPCLGRLFFCITLKVGADSPCRPHTTALRQKNVRCLKMTKAI
jgi:hypothetical protein